jgi:predicted PP-loop superfamily ATPase
MIKKRCGQCGLPNTYPGIKFNAAHTCNYCLYYELYQDRELAIKKQLEKAFYKIIRDAKKNKNQYDCVVAYSGGKDSTFLLAHLKNKFGLKILAHTLDNDFVSSQAHRNIKRITRALGVKSKITKPKKELLKEIFTYALTGNIPYPKEILAMMSRVCAVCLGMVFGTTINLAIRHKIPLMFIGFTPGQYPAISLENFLKVNSCIFLSDKVYKDDPLDILKIISDPIREKFGEKVKDYYFKSQYIDKGLAVPKVLLPYHALLDYDEKNILREIEKLGWLKPQDTDACSTNCLLNTVGNLASLKQLKYHPYIGELGYLVRQGKLGRNEAIEAEKTKANSFAMRYSLKKLGLCKAQIFQQ